MRPKAGSRPISAPIRLVRRAARRAGLRKPRTSAAGCHGQPSFAVGCPCRRAQSWVGRGERRRVLKGRTSRQSRRPARRRPGRQAAGGTADAIDPALRTATRRAEGGALVRPFRTKGRVGAPLPRVARGVSAALALGLRSGPLRGQRRVRPSRGGGQRRGGGRSGRLPQGHADLEPGHPAEQDLTSKDGICPGLSPGYPAVTLIVTATPQPRAASQRPVSSSPQLDATAPGSYNTGPVGSRSVGGSS